MRADETLPSIDDAQVRYARVLRIGVTAGMALLFVTFALYVLNLVPPGVPIAELPKYWGTSAREFLRATNAGYLHRARPVDGWAWVSILGKGDYLCLVGIAFLSSVTIACYVAILPGLLRRRDLAYAAMVVAECAVLILAASGVLIVRE